MIFVKLLAISMALVMMSVPSAFAASPSAAECSAMAYVLRDMADKSAADYRAAKQKAGAAPSQDESDRIDGLLVDANALVAIADDLAEFYDLTAIPAQEDLVRYRAMPPMTLRGAAIDCFP